MKRESWEIGDMNLGTRFKGAGSILVFLLFASVLLILLVPAPSTVAVPNGAENILTGNSSVRNTSTWPPDPWVDYPAGSNPSTMAAKEVGSGRVVAAGVSWSTRDSYVDDTGMKPMMVAIFRWLSNDKEPASTKILWYEGYGVYSQNKRGSCTKLVAYLIGQGYMDANIVADGTEPISSIDLYSYDIVFLPQLQLGPDGTGGDPSALPEADLEAMRNFVESGKGLLVMEGCDYGTSQSHTYYKVQNRILDYLDFGMYFQPDQLKKGPDPYDGFEVPFDVNGSHWIGSAYGGGTCILTSVCSMTTEKEAGPGVRITEVSPSFNYGGAGDTLTYEITVMNTGTIVDDYDFTAEDNADWGGIVISPDKLTAVEPNEVRTATLSITIPGYAGPGDIDRIEVTATSESDPGVSSSARMSAHVAEPPVEPVIGAWTFVQLSPRVLNYSMCVEGAGEYIYILNCSQSGSDTYGRGYYFMRYNTVTGYWEDLQLPPGGFKNNSHQMCWDGSNYLYAVSGGSYNDAEAQVRHEFWRYNITNNSWETLPDTPFWQGPGDALTWAKLGTDEYIYAVLGTSSSSVGWPSGSYDPTRVQFWRFDIDGNQWDQRLADIPYGADDGTNLVWTYGDNIYAFPGAYTEGLPKESERYFVRYSISENTWVEMEKVPYNAEGGVDDGGSLVYPGGDYIYALKGGNDPPGGSVPGDDFWQYSIPSDDWETLPNIPEGIGEMNGCRMGYASGSHEGLYYWVGPNNEYTVPERNLYVYGVAVPRPDIEVKILDPTTQSGDPGDTLSYTVRITNTGTISDNYDLTVGDNASPSWGPTLDNNLFEDVAPGDNQTTTLTVTIPTDAGDGDSTTVTVTATSKADNTVSDNDNCIARAIVPPSQGVSVSISPDENTGVPGENVTFTVTVKNTGELADNYDLTVGDNASPSWGPTLADSLFKDVASGNNRMTTLTVTIPPDAENGAKDSITVTATSQENENVSDFGTCTTTAVENVVREVSVSISPSEDNGAPGGTVTFTVEVTNEGNVDDTYDLEISGGAGWSPTLNNNSLSVGAGDSETTTLSVTVPGDASEGDSTSITVTATSQADSSVKNSDTCTVEATDGGQVEVSISPTSQFGKPGEELAYLVTIKNTGDLADTYTLEATANWDVEIASGPYSLGPGESRSGIGLTVTIPEGASGGDSTEVTVTASGTGYGDSITSMASATNGGGSLTTLIAIVVAVVVVVVAGALMFLRGRKAAPSWGGWQSLLLLQ